MIVSNSSPLIYLAALNDFHLLRELFAEIAIPQAVHREVVVQGRGYPAAQAIEQALGSWLRIQPVANQTGIEQLTAAGLDLGESEALILGTELNAEALLLDDQAGIYEAQVRGINIIRTPGVYRLAKKKGIIPAVRSKLDELKMTGFWLREEHYRIILRSEGELE